MLLSLLSRRRLFDTSLVSDSEESDLDDYTVTSPLKYFNNDPELPVYSQTSSGYNLQELIGILMSSSVSDDKVCHVQPLGIRRNCTFIIDLDSITVDDLKADDLGSWKSTGTRRSYFILNKKSQPEFLSAVPSAESSHFVIIHRYFVHQTCSKFHRCIVEIQSELCV